MTFIAGIYGINFIYIPELNLKWGYFGVHRRVQYILPGHIHGDIKLLQVKNFGPEVLIHVSKRANLAMIGLWSENNSQLSA